MRHVTASGWWEEQAGKSVDPLLSGAKAPSQLSGRTVKNGGGCVR